MENKNITISEKFTRNLSITGVMHTFGQLVEAFKQTVRFGVFGRGSAATYQQLQVAKVAREADRIRAIGDADAAMNRIRQQSDVDHKPTKGF